MYRFFGKNSAICALAAVGLMPSIRAHQGSWTHTSAFDVASQTSSITVSSTLRRKLTCTATWDGIQLGLSGGTGRHGQLLFVLMPYPGFGNAQTLRRELKAIGQLKYSIVCT